MIPPYRPTLCLWADGDTIVTVVTVVSDQSLMGRAIDVCGLHTTKLKTQTLIEARTLFIIDQSVDVLQPLHALTRRTSSILDRAPSNGGPVYCPWGCIDREDDDQWCASWTWPAKKVSAHLNSAATNYFRNKEMDSSNLSTFRSCVGISFLTGATFT